MKHTTLMPTLLTLLIPLLCLSCSGQQHAIQTVGETHSDTVYLTNVCFDSIYIDRTQNTFQKADTVYVEKTMVEYRFRQLRDTLRVHRVDSVPVIREVEVVRRERYIPWWVKVLSTAGVIALMVLAIRILMKYIMQGL